MQWQTIVADGSFYLTTNKDINNVNKNSTSVSVVYFELATFQHHRTQVHKGRSIKKMFVVEEFDWLAQRHDPSPVQQIREEVARRLWARPYRPTSVADFSNDGLKGSKSLWPGFQGNGSCCSRRLMPVVLEWNVQQSHVGVMFTHTVGHVVYVSSVCSYTEWC